MSQTTRAATGNYTTLYTPCQERKSLKSYKSRPIHHILISVYLGYQNNDIFRPNAILASKSPYATLPDEEKTMIFDTNKPPSMFVDLFCVPK
jgi:hypothetical protein